jgi:hypothetical protein
MLTLILDQSLVRGLRDRLYEKRKLAAIDLEKYIPRMNTSNTVSQIDKKLQGK